MDAPFHFFQISASLFSTCRKWFSRDISLSKPAKKNIYVMIWSQKRYITYQIETYDDTSYLLSSQKSCHTNSNTHYHVFVTSPLPRTVIYHPKKFWFVTFFQTWWFSSSSLAICNLIKSACISISFGNTPLAFFILGSLLHCSRK